MTEDNDKKVTELLQRLHNIQEEPEDSTLLKDLSDLHNQCLNEQSVNHSSAQLLEQRMNQIQNNMHWHITNSDDNRQKILNALQNTHHKLTLLIGHHERNRMEMEGKTTHKIKNILKKQHNSTDNLVATKINEQLKEYQQILPTIQYKVESQKQQREMFVDELYNSLTERLSAAKLKFESDCRWQSQQNEQLLQQFRLVQQRISSQLHNEQREREVSEATMLKFLEAIICRIE